MINHFTFNGTSTAQLGLIVSGVSIFGAGSRKVEKAGIPGRNGDLQIELGGFNNYTVRYTVSITKNFTTTAQQIREWLLESKGYCELTDTYHPDEIRKACFNSDIEFTTSMLYKYGQASIQFDCLPERYLTTNTPITTTATADTTTDTTMSLSTVPTPINISLNGNTTQEGTPTPSTPQAIHNVSGDNTINVASKNLQPNECTPSAYIGITTENSGEMIHYFGTASGSGGRTAHKMKHVVLSRGAYSFSAHNISTNGTTNLPDMVVQKVVGTTYTTIISRGLATGGAFSVTEETEISIGFNCYNGTTYNCYFNIQLEKGTTQTTYEPYTRQSYPLYLPVENYFDLNTVYADTQYFTIDGDSVTSNYFAPTKCYIPSRLVGKKCTFQAYIYSNPTTVNMRVRANVNGTNTDGNYIRYGEEGISSVSFTPTSTSDYVHITYSDVGGMVTVKNIMLSEGNLNHYNPYGNPSIELNKIGTYQDYIYKNGGKWYVHKAIGKSTINDISWTYSSGSALFYAVLANMTPARLSRAQALSPSYPFNSGDKFIATTSTQLRLIDSSYANVTSLKSAMGNVEIYYQLATRANTEITDTTLINQLNNLEKAYSYNGTTNILQVSNDNGFMLEVVSLHGSTFNSNYKGEPIITVNATGLIYLNGEVMEVLSAPVTINCQTMQCYNGVVNMNNEVRVNDFPEIKIGANEVGSSMALTITPNNWRH